MNTVVTPPVDNGTLRMTVMVRALYDDVYLTPSTRICVLRHPDADCIDALADYRLSYISRESENPSASAPRPTEGSNAMPLSINSLVDYPGWNIVDNVASASRPTEERSLSVAKYKLANRADEQARLFPELEKEIAERRKTLNLSLIHI